MKELTVSVIIPTYRRELYLVNTIKGIFNQEIKANEIIVIDQSPEHEDDTIKFLNENNGLGNIKWIKYTTPSASGARNIGIRESTSDILLFIDDDVEMDSKLIKSHLINYKDEKISAVIGKFIQPEGWHYPIRKEDDHLFDYKHFPLDGPNRVEGIATCVTANFSVRRNILEKIGIFDENYSLRAGP